MNKRIHILELCSEDAHNSWEFWSTNENKTEAECIEIVSVIKELISERKLLSLEHKFRGPYIEVQFNSERLEKEVRESMKQYKGDSDVLYWFSATDEGKVEDMANRARS